VPRAKQSARRANRFCVVQAWREAPVLAACLIEGTLYAAWLARQASDVVLPRFRYVPNRVLVGLAGSIIAVALTRFGQSSAALLVSDLLVVSLLVGLQKNPLPNFRERAIAAGFTIQTT
jgi:hypothetical protein